MPTSVAGCVGSGSGPRLRLVPSSGYRSPTFSGYNLRLISRSRQQLVLRELRQVLHERQVLVLGDLAVAVLRGGIC